MVGPSWVACALVSATWLPTALAQFNGTAKFVLNSMDPMLDFDSEGSAWTLDNWSEWASRHSYRDTGLARLRFVGTGYEAADSAEWKAEGANGSQSALTVTLDFENRPHSSPLIGPLNISSPGPKLSTMAPLSLAAYTLDLRYSSGSEVIFHNVTIDVPFRSQA